MPKKNILDRIYAVMMEGEPRIPSYGKYTNLVMARDANEAINAARKMERFYDIYPDGPIRVEAGEYYGPYLREQQELMSVPRAPRQKPRVQRNWGVYGEGMPSSVPGFTQDEVRERLRLQGFRTDPSSIFP